MPIPTISNGISAFTTNSPTAQPKYIDRAAPIPSLIAPTVKNTHLSFFDYLGTFGSIFTFVTGLALLGSPLLRKHSETVSKALTKSINHFRAIPLTKEKETTLHAFIQSKEKVEAFFKRIILGTLLILGINNYQTAYNSKQPSLFTTAIVRDAIGLTGIFYPKNFLFIISAFMGPMFSMGKRNDIDNNNHPEQRREWDLKRLTHVQKHPAEFSSQKSFQNDVRSFFHFLADDIRKTFTLIPWKQLRQNYNNKDSWKKPQSYQSNLSAQIVLLGALASTAGFLFKRPTVSKLSGLIGTLGGSIGVIPLFMRGWQNKNELDGKLTITGIPLSKVGELFSPSYFPNMFFLNGLAAIGFSFTAKGYELNSKRYKALVEETKWLQDLSLQNPDIRAQTVIDHFKQNPTELKLLEKKLGKSRVAYLFQLLQKAKLQERNGITLAQVLAPPSQEHPFGKHHKTQHVNTF